MALVIESGLGVPGATSYVALDAAQAVLDAREIGTTLTEGLLLRAMDTLEAQSWAGLPLDAEQALAFPRATIGLPRQIVEAQVWLAHYIGAGQDPGAVGEYAVKSERVEGAVDIEYAVPNGTGRAVLTLADLPMVYGRIRPYLAEPLGETADAASTSAVSFRRAVRA